MVWMLLTQKENNGADSRGVGGAVFLQIETAHEDYMNRFISDSSNTAFGYITAVFEEVKFFICIVLTVSL
jgi:uncharacterized protein with NRDE domain